MQPVFLSISSTGSESLSTALGIFVGDRTQSAASGVCTACIQNKVKYYHLYYQNMFIIRLYLLMKLACSR